VVSLRLVNKKKSF
jgi:hypothetical protein